MTKTLVITTMTVLLAGLVTFGLGNTSVFAASNLVANGSFEDISGTCSGNFNTLGSGNTAISGWTVGGVSIDWICNYWQTDDGNRSLDLSGLSTGSVTQDIATQAGKVYVLTFAMAGNTDGGNTVKSMTVSADSTSADYTFDTTGKSRSNMGWEHNTMMFVAEDDSTTLTFSSNEANPYGPALDNVSVEEYGDKKIDVCHKGKNTISISVSAVPAHIAHGDTLGPCQ